jgi:hypothetical protein
MALDAASSVDATREGRVPGRFWDRLSLHQKQVVWAWTFLSVPIVFYVVIRFWPTLEAFWLSFTNWNLLRPAAFVGFANYARLLEDALFWKVFRNTFAYLLLGTPISLVLAFVIAYHLDRVASCTASSGPSTSCPSSPRPRPWPGCGAGSTSRCRSASSTTPRHGGPAAAALPALHRTGASRRARPAVWAGSASRW